MHTNPPEERIDRASGEKKFAQRSDAGETDLTIILVHGRGQSPEDMAALADRLALSGVRYLFPRADDNTWYPQKFMAPIASNEPHLSAALAHYDSLVERVLAEGIPAERIIVGGFSQGACLSAEYLARHPRRFGAAVLWTGGLIGPRGTVWPLRSVLKGMPAFLSTAENDPWVPSERVRETYDWLIQSGAKPQMRIFEERDHGVLDEEIAVVREMIESVRHRQPA